MFARRHFWKDIKHTGSLPCIHQFLVCNTDTIIKQLWWYQDGQTLIGGRLRVVVLDMSRGIYFRGYGP